MDAQLQNDIHPVNRMRNDKMIKLADTDTDKVVDAYFTCVTSRWPRVRYHVGWDSLLVFIPLSLLPSFVLDVFFK